MYTGQESAGRQADSMRQMRLCMGISSTLHIHRILLVMNWQDPCGTVWQECHGQSRVRAVKRWLLLLSQRKDRQQSDQVWGRVVPPVITPSCAHLSAF